MCVLLTFWNLCVCVGVQPVVCGGVFRSGEYEPVARKKQMLQLQLCSEDWRCWQEDRGEAILCVCVWEHERERERQRERLFLTVCCCVCTFRWRVLRWCWVVTVDAVCLWAGEGRVEMQPLPMKPCRPAGHHVDGGGALRHVKSWTGTAWPCSTVPCKALFRHNTIPVFLKKLVVKFSVSAGWDMGTQMWMCLFQFICSCL